MTRNKRLFIRTILGDIDPGEIGLTYCHEHVIIDESYPSLLNPLFLLNDVDKISRELSEFYDTGGRTLVDAMPANCGRNAAKLADISRNTKVNIIASTGMHLEKYYLPGHWRYSYSAGMLTRLFIDDINTGIDRYDYGGPLVDRTPYRAGLIKVATGNDKITTHQEKIFDAVVSAHLETGAPILTHTNAGTLAYEQVDLFARLGTDLSHVMISHTDRIGDIDYHRGLLEKGITLEYDAAFRWKKDEENITLRLLESLLPDFPDQIVAGMDMAKNSYWNSYGGQPGINYLMLDFTEEMKKRGLEDYLDRLFCSTPARLFSFGIKN